MQTGQRVMPLYDSGYSVASRHSTLPHSRLRSSGGTPIAYGGPSARGGLVASIRQ